MSKEFDYGRYEKAIGKKLPTYTLFYWAARLFFQGIYRMHVRGAENIPPYGGFMICSNHLSFYDPPFVGCCFPYHIFYFARKTLLNSKAGRCLLPRLNTIPIDQERSDISGIRTTLRVLKGGAPVMAFPEGARSRDGKLQPAQPGIGMLIAKSGVPVLPVRIRGTFEALPRGASKPRLWPLQLHIGKMMPASLFAGGKGENAYLHYSQNIMEEIARL